MGFVVALISWIVWGLSKSLCPRHMAHSRGFVMVRGADDVCVDSDGLCACIYPWGHPSGWCPGVCGQDAHDAALSVPGHVGGGL